MTSESDHETRFAKELEAIAAMDCDPALKVRLIDEAEARIRNQVIKQANDDQRTMVKELSDTLSERKARRLADPDPITKGIWRTLYKGRPLKLPKLFKPKRNPGGGRKPRLTDEQETRGIKILQNRPKMPTDAACETLRENGIDASNTTLYERIVRPAYNIRK